MRLFLLLVCGCLAAVVILHWPGVFNGAHLLTVIFTTIALFGFRKPERRNERSEKS